MISLQWTTGILGVSIALIIIYLVRRDHLYTRYSVWWLSMAAAIFVLGVFPRISDVLAGWLGVSYPPSLIFILAGVLYVLKILTMDIERSKMEVKIRRLTQRLAIMEERLEHNERMSQDTALRADSEQRSTHPKQ
jgi:hypothetical protein